MKNKILVVLAVFALPFFVFIVFQEKHEVRNESVDDVKEVDLGVELRDQIENISYFIENEGQINDDRVKYYTSLPNGVSYVSDDELVYDFVLTESKSDNVLRKLAIKESFLDKKSKRKDFDISVSENERSESRVSYYVGDNEDRWQGEVGTYHSIELGEIWDNIEVSLNVDGDGIEKVFTINPGGDVNNIFLSLDGFRGVYVDDETHELIGLTDVEELVEISFSKPFAYQEVEGEKVAVFVDYEIKESSEGDYFYGFEVGDYNKALPLVIDPVMAGTYIGGASFEESRSCGDHVVDDSGNIIIAGAMRLYDGYPTTAGAYDSTWNGNYDAVISKFDSDLTTLIASTIFGGSGDDTPSGVRVDSSGKIFILGGTTSSDLPTTSGSYDETINGTEDLFVARFSSDLTTLEKSTFLGGTNVESRVYAGKLLIDDFDKIYVSGSTQSSDYPTAGSVYDTSYNSGYDIVVSKMSNDLSSLELSTYIGGGGSEVINDMDFDASGNILFLGSTNSSNFPTLPGSYDTSFAGWYDYIIFKMNSDLSGLLASTYYGGGNYDGNQYEEGGITYDSSGNIFITGSVSSPGMATSGAYAETGHVALNIYDGIIAKFNSGLSDLLAATYYGGYTGSNYDYMTGIVINSDDNPVIVGYTETTDHPTTADAYSTTNLGGLDVVLGEFSSDLSSLNKSTYFGGNGSDLYTKSITLDSSDNPQFLLTTGSTNFPTSATAYSTSIGGGTRDMAFVRLSSDLRLVSNTAPSDIALSSTIILENQSSGTTVGTLSVTDPDVGNVHTYTLGCSTPGVDDSFFSISGTNLLSGDVFDYEAPTDSDADGSYEICIHVDDNDGGTYDEDFSITIGDVVENTAADIVINSAAQLRNGSGKVKILISISDADADISKIKVQYESDKDGVGDGPWENAILSDSINADFGFPNVNNSSDYQVGNVQTSSGVNTVEFYWKTKSDIPKTNSNQYIRITPNDETLDGTSKLKSVFVDNEKPGKPDKPDLRSESDTGTFDDDNITSDRTPTFDGECTNGNEVTLYAENDIVDSGVNCEGGTYEATSEELSEGEYGFSITETDSYGNVSDRSDALDVLIDDFEDVDIEDEDNTPKNLNAEAISDSSVRITWEDKSETENGYSIERREEERNSFEVIANVSKDSEEYIDSGLKPGTIYYYRVRAYQGDSFSNYSNEDYARTFDLGYSEGKKKSDDKKDKAISIISPDEEEIKRREEKTEKVLGTGMMEFIKNETVISEAVPIGGALSGVALMASAGSIPFLMMTPGPLRLNLISLISYPFYRRKNRKSWGVVFDAYTKQPLGGVLVNLISEKGRSIDQVMTDKQGRFGFLIAKDGDYHISIEKGDYRIKKDEESDALYGKLYKGETFHIEREGVFKLNIALSAKDFDWDGFAKKIVKRYTSIWSVVGKYVLTFIYVIGFLLTLMVVYLSPSAINYLILISYIVITVVQIFKVLKKDYGEVVSKKTNNPVPFAMIALYVEEGRKAFAISDVIGRYYLLVDNGKYDLQVNGKSASGESFSKRGVVQVDEGILTDRFRV